MMNLLRSFAVISLLAGTGLMVLGVIQGGGGGLFIIFPFVFTTGLAGAFGAFLIIISFLLFFLDLSSRLTAGLKEPDKVLSETSSHPLHTEAVKRGGGFILIGPLPIVFGTDRSILPFLVLAGVVLTLIAVAIFLLL